jgi:hypothetical protein
MHGSKVYWPVLLIGLDMKSLESRRHQVPKTKPLWTDLLVQLWSIWLKQGALVGNPPPYETRGFDCDMMEPVELQ